MRAPIYHPRGPRVPSYLFSFRARISFEARESWRPLQREAAGSDFSSPILPPTPLPGEPLRNSTHQGAGGPVRAWGSWETLLALKHSRPLA